MRQNIHAMRPNTYKKAPERSHDASKHSPECARTFARMRPAMCPNTSRTFARCARTLPSMRPIRRCIVCVWLAARCCIQPPSTDIHSLGLLRKSGCGFVPRKRAQFLGRGVGNGELVSIGLHTKLACVRACLNLWLIPRRLRMCCGTLRTQ